jgi:hypothetical protein
MEHKKIHDRVHRISQLVRILSRMNPHQILPSYIFFQIHFNIILAYAIKSFN